MHARLRQALRTPLRNNGLTPETGQALVLFAIGLVAFCGLVGMSVDIGRMVFTRTDVQKIADASALAGAQDLPGSTTNATTSANGYATKNGASSTTVTFGSANSTITVKATRHINYTFLRLVGFDGKDVSASATAKATKTTITGYTWAKTAPFVVWGGSRQKEVHQTDKNCQYHTCVNSSYTFWSNQWLKDSGTPTSPDWTASNSNNFKGDVNHGAGAPSNEIGDFFSDGGNGSATTPADGSIIVVPLVDKASDGSNSRQFHIVAWLMIKVDAGCNKGGNTACTGTVLSPATTDPPPGYDGNGSVQPPGSLTYTSTTVKLIA